MFCESCGESTRPGIKFCEACGHGISPQCPACGASGPATRRFCGDCGASMQTGNATSNATSAAPARTQSETNVLAGGERRHLTVMFCDLVGSTALSQRLDPEDLSRLMQAWTDEATRAIRSHGGYVARFMGDGILSYFGYPKAFEDNAARSVRAAQTVLKATQEIAVPKGVALQTRVGIASGETVTGHTAEGDAGVETLAIGRTPNLAARLQGLAEPDSVVVSDSTWRRLRGEFRCDSLGPQTLKGFDHPEQAWVVVDQAGIGASHAARKHTLVQRDNELVELTGCWNRAQGGNGQVVLLSGEPGIGKSTLSAGFIDSLGANQQCIRLACRASREGRAFGPVIDYFSNLAAIHENTGSTLRETLKLNLPRALSADNRSVDLIADLILSRNSDAEQVAASDRRSRILQTITAWVTGLCEKSPLLLFIEDLHWADASTLDWLDTLAQLAEGETLMLMITSRPGVRIPWEPAAHIHALELGRLRSDGTENIIRTIAGEAELPSSVVELVVNRTDGVPLFVEEMTHAILESDALVLRDGRWSLTGSVADIGVPDSLQDLLMARLDRTPEARETAQLASVLGREFTQRVLMGVGETTSEEIESSLNTLENDNLVRRRSAISDAWYFRHALVRDAAYESLLKSQRTKLHARCAQVLEALDPELRESEPERLAWHCAHAGQASRSRDLWIQAARKSRANWANAEAADYFHLALSQHRLAEVDDEHQVVRLGLLVDLGQSLRSATGSSSHETRAAFAEAAEIASTLDAPDDQLAALYGLFIAHFTAANLQQSDAVCGQLEAAATGACNPAARVAAHQARGMQAFATGEFDLARSALEQAIAQGSNNGIPKALQFPVTAQSYLCWTLHLLGESDAALKLLDTALESSATGPGYDHALLLGNGCYLHQMRGDANGIARLSGCLESLATERHLPAWVAVADFFQAFAACTLAPSAQELERLERSLEAWSEDEIETPYFKCLVAERLLAAGRIPAASQMTRDAINIMQSTGETWYQPQSELLLERMESANQ